MGRLRLGVPPKIFLMVRGSSKCPIVKAIVFFSPPNRLNSFIYRIIVSPPHMVFSYSGMVFV